MVCWQQNGCYKIDLSTLRSHCMNGFHMNEGDTTRLFCVACIRVQFKWNTELQNYIKQNGFPTTDSVNRKTVAKMAEPYKTSCGANTHQLTKRDIYQRFSDLLLPWSRNQKYQFDFAFFMKPKTSRKKKILDKPNNAICSVDQSQQFRIACRWDHATRAIYWLTRQPVAMATWRWMQAEWEWWVEEEDAATRSLL